MYELNYLIFLLFICLSIFQTISGVGILVLGTPMLIFYGLNIIDVMALLLPLSIFNSFINLLYFFKFKKGVKIDINLSKYFFFICLPAMFVGLIFLKKFNNYINFNLLIGLVILFVLILSQINKKNFSESIKKIIIFVTGVLHGVTNSGGSLLSLIIVNSNDKNVNLKRINIIFFYFFLATFQFLSLGIIFKIDYFESFSFYSIFPIGVGIIIGNYLALWINIYQLNKMVKLLAFISSIILISNS